MRSLTKILLLLAGMAAAGTYSPARAQDLIKTFPVKDPKGVPIAEGVYAIGNYDGVLRIALPDSAGVIRLDWGVSSVPEDPWEPEPEPIPITWGGIKAQYRGAPKGGPIGLGTPRRELTDIVRTMMNPPEVPINHVIIVGGPDAGEPIYWDWERDFAGEMGISDETPVMMTPIEYGGVSDWDVGLMRCIYKIGDGPLQLPENLTHPSNAYPLTVGGDLTGQEYQWVQNKIDEINAVTSEKIPQGALQWSESPPYYVEVVVNGINHTDFDYDQQTFEIYHVEVNYQEGILGIGNENICRKELYRAVTGAKGNCADSRLGVLESSPGPWTQYDLTILEWNLDDQERKEASQNQTQAIEFTQVQ